MKTLKKNTKGKNRGIWPKTLCRLLWLLLIPSTLLLIQLASNSPDAVERIYAQNIYVWISTGISALTALVPLSIAEFVLFGLIVAAIVLLIITAYKLLCHRVKLVHILRFLISLTTAASILFSLFYLMWGFNHFRPELSALMNLTVRERPVSALSSLCENLIADAKALRENLPEDGSGSLTFASGKDYDDYFAMLPQAYETLGKKHELFSRQTRAAKGVSVSKLMSEANIVGIYIPFTAEANVNVDKPPFLLPASAAHEMAHYLGFAREDEANFIAYLACIASDDDFIAYSGVMLALIHAMSRLYDADGDAYHALRADYSAAMERDLEAHRAYWAQFHGKAAQISTELNDAYLIFNNHEEGVLSYGMMVDLLLAYYD